MGSEFRPSGNLIDSLGRIIDLQGRSVDQMRQLIASLASGETRNRVDQERERNEENREDRRERASERLENLTQDLEERLGANTDAQNTNAQRTEELNRTLQTFLNRRQERQARREGRNQTSPSGNLVVRANTALVRANRGSFRSGSGANPPPSSPPPTNQITPSNVRPDNTNPNPSENADARNPSFDARYFENQQNNLLRTGLVISSTLTALLGGFDILGILFGSMVDEERKFARGMKEIAFQTQGITSESYKMQNSFMEIGKTAVETGFKSSEFQNHYLNNLKKGNRSQKEALGVTKTSLNLAFMIGSSAAETSSMFRDWNMHLDLGENQMSEISRGIQQVARQSGITGDNLLNVTKSSEKFLKDMRAANTLTASAAKNAFGLRAGAEKTGIGDKADEILSGLSSTTNLYNNINDKTRNLLFGAASAVGKIGELQTGQILQNKSNIKAMKQGTQAIAESIVGAPMELWNQLDPGQLMAANLRLEQVYGMKVGEFQKFVQVLDDQSKSTGDRLSDIDKQLQNQNLTLEERTHLEKQAKEIAQAEGFDFLNKVDETFLKGKDFGSSLSSVFSGLSEEARNDLKAIGADLNDPVTALKSISKITAKSIKDAGGMDFTPQLEEAIANEDQQKMRELLSQMNGEQRKLGIEAANNADPMFQVEQTMAEMNDSLRGFVGPAINALLGILGTTGIIAGYVALIAANGAIGIANLQSMFGNFSLSNMFGSMGDWFGGLFGNRDNDNRPNPNPRNRNNPPEGPPSNNEAGSRVLDSIKNFKFDTKGWMDAGKELGKAALAMTIATVGLVAIATVIIATSKMIFGIAGLKPEEALKLSFVIAGLIGGVAVIALALSAATESIRIAGEINGQEIYRNLMRGSLQLILLSTAIVALGTAIVTMARLIFAVARLDTKTIGEIVNTVTALITGAGLISLAVLGTAWALSALGANSTFLSANLGNIAIGAGVLLAATPAIMLLAGAMLGLVALVSQIPGMDSKTAAEIGQNIGTIMLSAGMVATGVLLAAGSLAALGYALPLITGSLPFMAIGAGVLLAATPVIALLAGAVIGLSHLVMKIPGMDSKTATDTAWQLGSILMSAGAISLAVLASAGALAALGAASFYLTGALLFIGIGAGVLLAAAPVMTALAVAVIGIASVATLGMDPKYAATTAENIASILTSAGKIAYAVLGSAAALTALGAGSILLIASIPLMRIGAGALAILTPVMLGLTAALIGIVNLTSYLLGISPETAETAAKTVSGILNGAGSIAESVISASAKLTALGVGSILIIASLPVMALGATTLLALTPMLIGLTAALANVVNASSTTLDPAEADKAIKNLTTVSGVIGAFSGVITGLQTSVLPLTKKKFLFFGGTQLDKLIDSTKVFQTKFTSIATFIKDGIIEPSKQMGELEEMGAAKTKLSHVKDLISNLVPTLDVFSKSLIPLTQLKGWYGFRESDIGAIVNAREPVKKGIEGVALFIADIVYTVKNSIQDEEPIKAAASKLKSVTDLVSSLTTATRDIMSLAAKNDLHTTMQKVGSILSDDIVKSIITFFPEAAQVQKAVDKVTTVVDLLDLLAEVMTKLSATFKSMQGGFNGGLVVGGGQVNVSGGIEHVQSKKLLDLAEQQSGPSEIVDKARQYKYVEKKFADVRINDMLKQSPGGAFDIGPAIRYARSKAEGAVGPAIKVADIRTPGTMGDGVTDVKAAQDIVATAKTASLVEVGDKIRQEYAAADMGDGKLCSDTLNRIANSGELQVEHLKQLVKQMEELIRTTKDTNNLVGDTDIIKKGSTATKQNNPQSPVNYGNLQFGKYHSNASRNVINTGT